MEENKEVSLENTPADETATMPEPKIEITRDDVIKQIIQHAEKTGRKFDTPEYATKWAERYLEQGMEKMRAHGIPVCCNMCGKSGANAKTGPLIKDIPTGYKHRNCI